MIRITLNIMIYFFLLVVATVLVVNYAYGSEDKKNDMVCTLINKKLAIYRCENKDVVCYVKYKSKMDCEPKREDEKE